MTAVEELSELSRLRGIPDQPTVGDGWGLGAGSADLLPPVEEDGEEPW